MLRKFFIRKLQAFFYNLNFILVKNKGSIHKSALLRGCRINGDVTLGEGCKIIGGVLLSTESKIIINRYSSINGPNTDLINYINPIIIGSFTSIARNVSIQEFNHNYDTITSYLIFKNIFKESKSKDISSKGQVTIGNDVWIGTQSIILSGSSIGNGAIVAANSVVVGDIPPYAIVAGSPAKVIKYRFSEEIIEALEKIKWWDWSIEKIIENKELFSGKLTIEKLNMHLYKL